MLKTGKQILEKARKGNYAVGAFNINNMEICQAIIEGATELKSPVILQTSEGAIEYAGIDYLYAIMKVASKAPVPVAIHLDHGKDYDVIKEAIKIGYTSVMIDGSDKEYKDNIAITKKVVNFAHKRGVTVEAELGAIRGKEDKVSVSEWEAHMTDPEQALDFVKKTGCDYLAVSIGTAHGMEKFEGKAELDLERLKKIKKTVKTPLVLHGASEVDERMVKIARKYGAVLENAKGVDDPLMKKAVKAGINKVNTDTDLRLAFDAGVRQVIKEKPDVYDPRKIIGQAREYMKEVVKERIVVLGSKNKA